MPADPQRQFDMCLIIFYLLDWGLLAQIWSGMSPCMTPGLGDCVVWWDAFAAVGAIGAVIATVVLGVFTYRLGVAANNASDAALKLAADEEKRQKTREGREKTLVLVQINGEVTDNQKELADIHRRLDGPLADELFVTDDIFRQAMLDRLTKVEFPITNQLVDRLHYLDDPIGPALVRCVAMLRSLNRKGAAVRDGRDRTNTREHYQVLCIATQVLSEDLESVRLACAKAIIDSGVDASRIARAESNDEGHSAGDNRAAD
ncbi:hypothetical protein [Stenotrophomonas maltophilia group sp. RNC7]|uniref:hypothetical protein n=1 Tax=Stenotrophomonas maltophilia group sp. RNC7 TaxID=3071467 RepID=UPI0027DF61AA|nr:hypothetical protein [Stenotrophomonas maltophilia group sp. RNC7]MDQ4681406.1 hypothetical protein [Stenotrophomonas maltophilia group sp. RNC7]